MDPAEFNRQLATAARGMAEEPGTQPTLERAVRMATDLIDDCDLAGVSVVTKAGVETPAASGEALRKIADLQYELNEGPCFDALRQEDVVTSTDLGGDLRWPTWGPRIVDEIEVHSSMSFRLFTTGDDIGALSMYSHRRNAFSHDDLLDGLTVAAHAAVALSASLQEDGYLARALHARTVIGQATGILMERFGLSPEQAFAVMQRVSSDTSTKLYRVANNIVETRTVPGH